MKNEIKSNYLQRIRSQSSYPVFRAVVNIFAILLYVCAGLLAIGSIATFSTGFGSTGLYGLVGAVILGIAAKVFQEASLMIADITDSLVDFNSRNEQKL